jgi:uncharacterized protein involved in response to NO
MLSECHSRTQQIPIEGTCKKDMALPEQWVLAYERDRQNPLRGNDPLPERRAARVLSAFILTGLVFVALPGTLLGVWNLLTIAGEHGSTRVSTAWIQAHGQAQLFGWVGTFILGISLYVLPKFLNRMIRKFGLLWLTWAVWTSGAGWRWLVGIGMPHWRIGIVGATALQLLGYGLAQYLLWFDRPEPDPSNPPKPFPGDLASWLGVVGFAAFGAALLLNFGISVQLALHGSQPVLPAAADRIFLIVSLWGFAIPVAWGYSTRFVTIFVGLRSPVQSAARWLAAGVAAIVFAALLHQPRLADALAAVVTLGAVWALQVFRPSVREPKRTGVYPHYPFFIRLAYLWLVVGAFLGIWADFEPRLTGLGGASRHALTVGFLAMLIFCVGPLILPSFLAGRQLRSPGLMGASLWLLAIGCFLRVTSEAVAYSATGGWSWKVLPVSGLLELTAVSLFVLNLGWTMMQPVPAWFGPSGVAPQMTVYFYVSSFPKTRDVLIGSGLTTLAQVKDIPHSLTLSEAVAADGADLGETLSALRAFFAARQPRRRMAT